LANLQFIFCWSLPYTSSWSKNSSLSETEIEQDGKRLLVRAAVPPAASLTLRAANVALPPTVQALAEI